MTPSKALFFFCISFIVGITLESFVKIPGIFLWGFLVGGVLGITAEFLVKKPLAIAGFCILFFILGIARFQISEFTMQRDPVARFNDGPEKVILAGTIIEEPDIRDTVQKLKVQIENTQSVVLVTAWRFPEYHYADIIKITGKLKSPAVFDDFNYRNYLAKDGVYSVMDSPKIELVAASRPQGIFMHGYEKILFFKSKLKESIRTNFVPAKRIIMEGIILGSDKNMPKEARERLNGTGLSHLTAVSGSNVIILSYIMMSFLLALGFWRGQAFYFSIIFIWLYIVIAGFPTSGIRAAIMASIFLSSQKFGRQNTSFRVIVLAAALMLFHKPMLLAYDIGFQLSFLASLGIMYVKPLIDSPLHIISKQKFKNLTDVISITLSAQIFTLPVIAYYFNTISLIAPLTNLLIVPTIDWLMVFALLSSVSGVFSGFLGWVFAIPCHLLLIYFFKVVDIFYQPFFIYSFGDISWLWLVFYYIVLSGIIATIGRFQRPDFQI